MEGEKGLSESGAVPGARAATRCLVFRTGSIVLISLLPVTPGSVRQTEGHHLCRKGCRFYGNELPRSPVCGAGPSELPFRCTSINLCFMQAEKLPLACACQQAALELSVPDPHGTSLPTQDQDAPAIWASFSDLGFRQPI